MDECLNTVYSKDKSYRALGRKRQKLTTEPLTPIVFGHVLVTKESRQTKTARILLDSGASSSLITSELVKKLRTKTEKPTLWSTAAGDFKTSGISKISFQLMELSPTAELQWKLHVHKGSLNGYDMILGRDILTELGIDLCFSDQMIKWPKLHAEIPMKPLRATKETHFFVQEPPSLINDATRMSKILDAKYAPADLHQVAKNTKHLTNQEQAALEELLRGYEELFDGTVGTWKGKPYHIHLKEGVTPYHAKPFPVPKAYELTLRKEVERLCKLGIIKKVNRSEWAAPSFIIPKKDQTVRFINDFRELNKRIRQVPYPIPKISDVMLKLEGFQYATSLDLNMGYYHIKLDPESAKLCTLVFPWGKYEMQALPMGLCNSPDIFQEKMSELMQGLNFVRCYIDDLLVISNGTYEEHLKDVQKVLERLKNVGLKVNANKSSFCQPALEYLGYWITRDGISPLPKKVEAIKNIAPPKNKRDLRRFIGLINYYRDAWIRRSDALAPLAALTSKTAEWKWTDKEQKAFEQIKRIVAREVLLAFPDFSKPFEIYTDASKYQLGAAITQNQRPIAYYSRKLNSAQLNYTTTERELLAIVETLKEFRNILLGQQIIVYTDHKNLTYKVFNTERVMRWRLIIEEYGPELHYLKGEKNVVADALSRLQLEPPLSTQPDPTVLDQPTYRALAEAFGIQKEEIPDWINPINLKLIQKVQQTDKQLLQKARTHSDYSLRSFRGGGKIRQLICKKDKIVVPEELQKRMVQWYHEYLCHPGETRTELTINQHFTWTGLRKTVHEICSKCDQCQRTKRTKKKYGKLPEKVAETIPWQKLCVDMIGPYKIPRKGKKDLELWAVTMIDPATGWFEIAEVPGTKRADVVSNIVEQRWLSRYPWPEEVILDRGTEFMAEFTKMIEQEYNLIKKPITRRNPQANAIIERVHQTIGNMLRTFSVHSTPVDEDDPWSGILSAIAFGIRATVSSTTRATPMQLVFGRDAMLSIVHQANWQYIKERKQRLIKANNKRENASRLEHKYQVGDLVLIKTEQSLKYGSDAYEGPAQVEQVHDNGTVRVRLGPLRDIYNIRNITPYTTPS